MWTYRTVKGRLSFRPITEEDAYLICAWRNTGVARQAFYNQAVVTPDTHIKFMRNRPDHDLIWMICTTGTQKPIGMTSLTINPQDYTAEYGRAFILPGLAGKGFGQEQEYMILSLAFEFFNLGYLWGDVLVGNDRALNLHTKTGWTMVGIDVEGHCHERGSVLHIEYPRIRWSEYRPQFVDKYGECFCDYTAVAS